MKCIISFEGHMLFPSRWSLVSLFKLSLLLPPLESIGIWIGMTLKKKKCSRESIWMLLGSLSRLSRYRRNIRQSSRCTKSNFVPNTVKPETINQTLTKSTRFVPRFKNKTPESRLPRKLPSMPQPDRRLTTPPSPFPDLKLTISSWQETWSRSSVH